MPTCAKCRVLTSTSKRCPHCRTCYCSKVCRSTDWPRHKSECTSGETVSSASASSSMAPFDVFSGKNHKLSSFCDEYQRMYPNEPREHYERLTNLGILVHSQLNFLHIMSESLRDLCRVPGFGPKRFGVLSYDPYDQLNLKNKRPGDIIEMSCGTWSTETSQTFFFANTCELPVSMTDTHIAFGFNDLGILMRLEVDEKHSTGKYCRIFFKLSTFLFRGSYISFYRSRLFVICCR
jgi:hypothetical protein